MNWMKWTSEVVLAAMVITVPVAMLVVLLPGVALVRLVERLGALEPEVISPMPVLALAVFVADWRVFFTRPDPSSTTL